MIYIYFRSLPSCSIPKSTHDIINKGSKTWTVFSCVIIYIAAIIQRYLCAVHLHCFQMTDWMYLLVQVFKNVVINIMPISEIWKAYHGESPSDSKQFSKISIIMWECFWASLPPSMWKGLKDPNEVSFLMTLRMGFENGPDPQDFWFDTKLVYKYV